MVKVIGGLVALFVLYTVVVRPEQSAALVQQGIDALVSGGRGLADSIFTFLNKLTA